MSKITAKEQKRLDALQQCHYTYKDYNQRENNSNIYMAQNGHPFADEYRKLRNFFDSLRYAANSGARFITYLNDMNYTQYWTPSLGVNGTLADSYSNVYPSMGDVWNKYLEACAEAGWPSECEPRLYPGSFIIRTTNPKLVGMAFIAVEGKVFIPYQENNQWNLHIQISDSKHVWKLIKIIDSVNKQGKIERLPVNTT